MGLFIGVRGLEFESRHPDPLKSRPQRDLGPCCFWPVQTWFKRNHQKHIEIGDYTHRIHIKIGDFVINCMLGLKSIFPPLTAKDLQKLIKRM